jgi:hypothetical protein
MSEKNVELARRLFPVGSFDLTLLLDRPELTELFEPFVHPDFETVGTAIGVNAAGETIEQQSGTRTVYGIEGFREGWREFLTAWDSWVVSATEFLEVDDERVLVLLDVRARSKTHGVELPIDSANLLTFQNAKLARLQMFNNRQEALEAAGLGE